NENLWVEASDNCRWRNKRCGRRCRRIIAWRVGRNDGQPLRPLKGSTWNLDNDWGQILQTVPGNGKPIRHGQEVLLRPICSTIKRTARRSRRMGPVQGGSERRDAGTCCRTTSIHGICGSPHNTRALGKSQVGRHYEFWGRRGKAPRCTPTI